MTSPASVPGPAGGRHTSRAGILLVLSFALFAAPGISGCASGNHDSATWTAVPAAATPMDQMGAADRAARAAWAGRPAFVKSNARTEAAYGFAMASPAVLKWIPCYCGCGAMGHGSNLDCFFKPTMDGLTSLTFEEHASFCDICVDEALTVQRMLGDGQSLRSIRDAIDSTYGGAAPGTPTELPPA